MPEYRTRLFECEEDIQLPVSPALGRGWSVYLKGLTVPYRMASRKAEELGYNTIIACHKAESERKVRYAPEIIIAAPNRVSAQRALNLMSATSALWMATQLFEEFTAFPCNRKKPEGLNNWQYDQALGQSIGTNGLWKAAKIAAKATWRTKWQFAVAKYLVSLKISSVHPMDHSPREDIHYGIEKDPIEVIKMAQAILSAFSVLEELGLEVRASSKKPSKIDCQWNLPVLEDLQKRLAHAGVDKAETFNWILRGTPRRIERKHSIPKGGKSPWTRRRIRDRQISIVDAIHYAGLLRSKAAAHASGSLTRSLTMTDVSNIQDLARRLALETLGFWRDKSPN